ncbi:MAG: hypothetical protein LBL86_12215 [Coriobacteriales bacterium]|jgi:hypothetical protein|nr:hypothetical protein [Coriobacteriales bacterium]
MGLIAGGVYPVFENVFKVGVEGKASSESDMKPIADVETFSVSFDDNVEEWTPMTTKGWRRALKTGKAFTVSLSGKRNIGDEGNDYVAGLAFKTGQDCETRFEWVLPDGTTVKVGCIVNITGGGGDSTNVDGLDFEVMSNGEPTVTAAG